MLIFFLLILYFLSFKKIYIYFIFYSGSVNCAHMKIRVQMEFVKCAKSQKIYLNYQLKGLELNLA